MRDSQRQRTYDAENRAFVGTLAESPLTFAEVNELTQAIAATPWWGRHGRAVTVVRGRGAAIYSNFDRSTGVLTLTEAQQNPSTLAHELAHAASDDGHGPEFRAALCALVLGVCGSGPAATLQTEFRHANLAVGPIDAQGLPDPPLLARHPRFST